MRWPHPLLPRVEQRRTGTFDSSHPHRPIYFKRTAATPTKPTFVSSYALLRRAVIWRGWYGRSENEAADHHCPNREDDRPGAGRGRQAERGGAGGRPDIGGGWRDRGNRRMPARRG